MIKILILSLILLSACSFKTPPNQWQYKSATAFNSYTQNFLSMEDVLAKDDLHRAIKHAKKSADLTQLAKIYLGECALNISVGVDNTCPSYENISNLLESSRLNAYYSLITKNITADQTQYLPQQYKEFALQMLNAESQKNYEYILRIKQSTSALLCGALIKEKLSPAFIEKMIQLASYNGYKKAVLFWLNEKLKQTHNEEEIQKIKKRIAVLIT